MAGKSTEPRILSFCTCRCRSSCCLLVGSFPSTTPKKSRLQDIPEGARRGPTIRRPSPPSLRSGVPRAGSSQVGTLKTCSREIMIGRVAEDRTWGHKAERLYCDAHSKYVQVSRSSEQAAQLRFFGRLAENSVLDRLSLSRGHTARCVGGGGL